MKEIGNVRLNYMYYDQRDIYSDGDVEEKLLEIVKNNVEYEDIVYNTDEFPIYYHLSKEREFIVDIMDITKKDTVLEIGAGCGAITGALASKAGMLHCVELSKRRSLINAYKNRNHKNIEIFVGNYQNINFTEKYDVITLIGVFEYATYYYHTENAYVDFLCDVWGKLETGGRLYIAIENRLGAKYFAGCVEDHAGTLFEGIEGYNNFTKVRTFSYHEWIRLLKKCGIEKYRFYYPYPDYKFPQIIYSDKFLPNVNEKFIQASNYTSDRRNFFDENNFFNSLVIEEEFKLFSNSFLICLYK